MPVAWLRNKLNTYNAFLLRKLVGFGIKSTASYFGQITLICRIYIVFCNIGCLKKSPVLTCHQSVEGVEDLPKNLY